MGGHVPRRRCVGCGRIAPKPELLRIALADSRPARERAGGVGGPRVAVLDPDGIMPGRGAYLCRDLDTDRRRDADPRMRANRACLEHAMRRGGIARALRTSVTLEREIVESGDE